MVSVTSRFAGQIRTAARRASPDCPEGAIWMAYKRGGPLRLIRSLRDAGALLWDKRGERPVAYAIDVYSQGERQSGDGDVRGDLASLVGRVPTNVRLRLADGVVVAVALTDIESDSATVELLGPLPPPAA